jgi:hypothetical protein
LKVNGGILDEVIFALNTENPEDLAYLDELVASTPGYKIHAATQHEAFNGAWESVTDPDAIYIKIDDDVVSGVLPYQPQRIDGIDGIVDMN